MKNFFNVAFRTFIPVFNQIADVEARKIQIPNEFAGILIIKDATFAPKNGYLALTAVPEFVMN